MKRVVSALFAAQTPSASKEKAVREAERRPDLGSRTGTKPRRVHAIRHDVHAGRVEPVRTARVCDLLRGGHDRLALAKDRPVPLGVMASRERDETTLLPEYVDRAPCPTLPLQARLDQTKKVAMEHHNQGCHPVDTAPDELIALEPSP